MRPKGEIGGQPTRWQEIHLPGAGFDLGGCRDDAQRQPGADDTDGATQDRLIADDEGRRQAALGPELGDDLGTDARRIAHGECGSAISGRSAGILPSPRPQFKGKAKSPPAAPPGLSLGSFRAAAGAPHVNLIPALSWRIR